MKRLFDIGKWVAVGGRWGGGSRTPPLEMSRIMFCKQRNVCARSCLPVILWTITSLQYNCLFSVLECLRKRFFVKKNAFKNPHVGGICETFLTKSKKYISEGRYSIGVYMKIKVEVFFALLFIGLWFTTHSICSTQLQPIITEHLPGLARTTSCLLLSRCCIDTARRPLRAGNHARCR